MHDGLELIHACVRDLEDSVVLAVSDLSLTLPILLNVVICLGGIGVILKPLLLGLEVLDFIIEVAFLLLLTLVGSANLLFPAGIHSFQKTKHRRHLSRAHLVHLLNSVLWVEFFLGGFLRSNSLHWLALRSRRAVLDRQLE